MSYVKCNLCGGDSYSVAFEAGIAQVNRVVKCKQCTLMYANPRVQESDVESIEHYDPDFVLDNISKGGRQRLEKEVLQIRDYESTRDFLQQSVPGKGKLIEIGSGLGHLIDYFRQDGWETLGIEPNVGLCRYAERELHLEVMPTILEDAKLPDGFADAALMMHVIEHVPDPKGTFSEVFRILKPGGFFVLETPRYDTLMFSLLGKRERSLSCDGHIYFFTTSTLSAFAKRSGFNIVRTDYVGRSLTMDRLLYNFGVVSKSQFVKDACKSVSNTLGLQNIRLKINLRDMQRMYLQKPQ